MMIEYRIQRFQELVNNKWYYIMNHVLDVMRTTDKKERAMLMNYGSAFYY